MLVSSAIRDVSERRRLEELRRHSLQEASRLKSEFLANMSHELRTPLNAIIGFAELMHDGKVGPLLPEQKEYLGDILTSSRHLLQLINDVLDLSKVESGKMEFRPEPVDVSPRWSTRCATSLRSLASAKRITPRNPGRSGAGRGGASTPDGSSRSSTTTCRTRSSSRPRAAASRCAWRPWASDRFRLEVEDTGIGIAPEELERLFVEFQQLDASTAKKYAGTGLGLALTRRIVEAQGGEIGVRSAVGQGSVFSADLPRVAAAAAPPGARVEPARVFGRVLIVDDDPRALKLAERALFEAGLDPVSRSDAERALEVVERGAPAAIVMDLLMPGMTGFELLERLRLSAHSRNIPVVVWTEKDTTADERRRLAAGAQAVVLKRDGLGALVDELRRWLPRTTGEAE